MERVEYICKWGLQTTAPTTLKWGGAPEFVPFWFLFFYLPSRPTPTPFNVNHEMCVCLSGSGSGSFCVYMPVCAVCVCMCIHEFVCASVCQRHELSDISSSPTTRPQMMMMTATSYAPSTRNGAAIINFNWHHAACVCNVPREDVRSDSLRCLSSFQPDSFILIDLGRTQRSFPFRFPCLLFPPVLFVFLHLWLV